MVESAVFAAGFFRDEERFKSACAAAVSESRAPEAFSPYPVHGIEQILGIKRSWIGRPVFGIILLGAALALHMEYFTMVQDWPLNVGGKPYFAWQTFKVVALESGLLLGSLTNFLLAFHTCRLLPHPHTRLLNDRMTDDTFTVVLPVRAGEEADALIGWLMQHGAEEGQIVGAKSAADAGHADGAARAEAAHG